MKSRTIENNYKSVIGIDAPPCRAVVFLGSVLFPLILHLLTFASAKVEEIINKVTQQKCALKVG
jgi:hypothetical protein